MTDQRGQRPEAHRQPLVVGIGGSMNDPSGTTLLLNAALELVAAEGARTVAFTGPDLAALPVYTPGVSVDRAAADFVRVVRECDAVIVATPGYHGGMSGLVKNALDHLEALREDGRPYLDGRPVGVIVTAAGWQGAGSALSSVRATVHALRGWPTPYAVTVNSAEQPLRPGAVADGPVLVGLRILTRQIVDFLSWREAAHEREALHR